MAQTQPELPQMMHKDVQLLVRITIPPASEMRARYGNSMVTILLAEDSSTHTALMRSVLEQDGHRVICVVNGQLAWEAAL